MWLCDIASDTPSLHSLSFILIFVLCEIHRCEIDFDLFKRYIRLIIQRQCESQWKINKNVK